MKPATPPLFLFLFLFFLSREKNGNVAQEEFQVADDGVVVHVRQLHVDSLRVARPRPPLGGPGSEDPRAHAQEIFGARSVPDQLLGDHRAGPHQGHVSPDHVHQLGELVQVREPQEMPHRRDPRVLPALELEAVVPVVGLELRIPVEPCLRIDDHGPELEAPERGAAPTTPLMAKEDRAAGRQPDRQGARQEQRRSQQQEDRGQKQVE